MRMTIGTCAVATESGGIVPNPAPELVTVTLAVFGI
jgi:hypothetical protein